MSGVCRSFVKTLKDVNPDGFIHTRAISASYTPIQFASLYNFPIADGTGQKIGIIQLGGGYYYADLQTYFTQLGIEGEPNVTSISVDGAYNNPTDTSGANLEVILDTEIIISIVPKAETIVYFAPNSFSGFYNAINRARTDGCNVISISWGAPEPAWTSSTIQSFNTLFKACAEAGIIVTAAAGDNGSSDGMSGNNVDFPASSPYVVGCGGTYMQTANSVITSEVVWNDGSGATGGGVSAVFQKPAYQSSLSVARRGVPDIAAAASPSSGYSLYGFGGPILNIGGTSAVAPLWAALVARINQTNGANMNINQLFYSIYHNQNIFRDITSGNNGAFEARTGWDNCTGMGCVIGQSLVLPVRTASRSQPIMTVITTAPVNTPIVPRPTATFAISATSGTPSTVFRFTSKATNAATHTWNFGNGQYSSLVNPTYSYPSIGVYTVTLTVTNSVGVSASVSKQNFVTVKASPATPSFTVTPTVVGAGGVTTMRFTNTSVGAVSYTWDLGNGKTSTAVNPTTVYNPGTYTVTLRARNASGVITTLVKRSLIKVNRVNSAAIRR